MIIVFLPSKIFRFALVSFYLIISIPVVFRSVFSSLQSLLTSSDIYNNLANLIQLRRIKVGRKRSLC